jgi:uncharacterized protein YndB with AHSA1/START domain
MTSLTLVRRIAASPEIVFDAVSTPEGIAAWWGPDAGPVLVAEMDARIGGRFRARFRMLDGSEHECCGTILALVRPRHLAMTWRWVGGREAEGESRIDIVLHPIGDEVTELVFTHALLPDADTAKGHIGGWNGSLDKLERLLRREGARPE